MSLSAFPAGSPLAGGASLAAATAALNFSDVVLSTHSTLPSYPTPIATYTVNSTLTSDLDLPKRSNEIYNWPPDYNKPVAWPEDDKTQKEGYTRFCRWFPEKKCADKDNCPEDQEYKAHRVQIYYAHWGVDQPREHPFLDHPCGYELKGWLGMKCTNDLIDWNCRSTTGAHYIMGINVEFIAGYGAYNRVEPGCIEAAFYGALGKTPDNMFGDNPRKEIERHIHCCNADDLECLHNQPGSPFPAPPPKLPAPSPTATPTTAPPSTTTTTAISTSFVTVTRPVPTEEPEPPIHVPTDPPEPPIHVPTDLPPEPPIHVRTVLPPEPPTNTSTPPGDLPACPHVPLWCPWCQGRYAWPPEDKENRGPVASDGEPCKENWPPGFW